MKSIAALSSEHLKALLEAQQNFNENNTARSAVGHHIAKLGDQISSIDNAMKNIQNISMQVKILSLNASVEAARAGAAGKGFSIVAEEIRRLSENTDAAATQISNAVSNLNTLIKNASSDMQSAQKIGAVFSNNLESCVESARDLSEQSKTQEMQTT